MARWIRRRKWAVVAAGVLLAALVLLLLIRPGHEVMVADAFTGPLLLRIAASGVVETESDDLGFQLAGEVVKVYVAEGDRVTESDILARVAPAAAAPGLLAAGDVIQAPYPGTIVEVYRRPGAVVVPGQPVLRLVSDSHPWVTAFIDSEDAAYIRPGTRFRCRAEGYLSQAWDIVVRRVGKEAVPRSDLPGSSRQVRVRCDVVSRSFPLTPGTDVDIDGEVCLAEDALLVPTAAVQHHGARDFLWVVQDRRARRREVRLGPNNFDLIAIREGLRPGETVVVEGKQGLTDGRRVRPKPLPPTADNAVGGA